MSVFWFGLKTKIKNAISKKYVDDNFLSKTNPNLQTVASKVDFNDNIVAKREAFVDIVGNGGTNIPNLNYIKAKDTLGMFRVFIKDYNRGRWDVEWIKKPTNWNDSDIAIDEIHISTSRIENNNLVFNSGGFQGWNNVRIPATAETAQLNNEHFKNNTKPCIWYIYIRLNQKLGGRTIKKSCFASFGYEKQHLEMEFSVNLTLPTKEIKKDKPVELVDSFFSKEAK